jgi:hypothetical protein
MLLKNVELKFSHLNAPDENGKWSTAFFCQNKQDEKMLVEAIDAFWAAEKGTFKKDPRSLGYGEYENPNDANDKNNGKIIFNANQNHKSADGQYTFTVDMYDAEAKMIEPDKLPSIGWGTKGNISVSFFCWTHKTDKGVKLNLEAVQILDLVEYGGENPFEAEQGSYVAPSNPFKQPDAKVSGI